MILEIYESHTTGALTVVDEIGAFASLRWRRKYFEAGEVELHAAPTARNVQALQAGRILLRADATEGGIIQDVVLSDDEIAVECKMLSHILKDRVTYPTFSFTGKTELGMRKLVQTYAVDKNKIPMLKLGRLNGFLETCELQATGKDLLAILTAMAKESMIGFRIRADVENNTLWFETYKGIDHTDLKAVQQPVEFCTENKNIENASTETHCAEHRNFAYVAGAGEGAARTVVAVDQTAGAYRRELWVDARDLQKGDMTQAQYTALLKQRGMEKLAQCQILKSFSADVVLRDGSAYKTDWDLGDTVTAAREDWNAFTKDMITEVEEVFEGATDTPTVTPVMGSGLPEAMEFDT